MLVDRHLSLVLIAVVALAGCRPNPQYCEDRVGHNCDAPPAVVDGQEGCVTNEQCTSPGATVCDTTASVCVECTGDQAAACTGGKPVCSGTKTCVQCTPEQNAACTGTTPVCGMNNQCQKCSAHAQCSSSACLIDGSCANQTDVAYVAPPPLGSDNTACTKVTPCTSVSKALQTNRRYLKFSGVTDEGDEVVSINNQDVTLLADPNAQLTKTKNGLLLEVRGSSHVTIYDLTITGASGAAGIGISVPAGSTGSLELHRVNVTNNTAGGILVAGSSFTVSQSTISSNQGGGISVTSGTFAIVGNVFFNNGGNSGNVGGVAISTAQNAMNRLEFNSFSRNQVQDGLGAAIHCVAGMFTARNNIMSENGTLTNSEQIGGTCRHAYSIARPGTPLPIDMGNSTSDPAFIDPARGNLHIQPGSQARRAADPASDLTGIASKDIDGDSRVSPADIGADQVP